MGSLGEPLTLYVCVCCCSVLLHHLAEDVDGLTSQIDRQLLRETVRAFTLTNDDLSTDAGANTESVSSANIQQAGHSCQVTHSGLASIHCNSHNHCVVLFTGEFYRCFGLSTLRSSEIPNVMYTESQESSTPSSILNGFSKFFHWQSRWKIKKNKDGDVLCLSVCMCVCHILSVAAGVAIAHDLSVCVCSMRVCMSLYACVCLYVCL